MILVFRTKLPMTNFLLEHKIQTLCNEYVPIDKSHAIRMATMDYLYGDAQNALYVIDAIPIAADDVRVVRGVIADLLDEKTVVSVGESGTVYRIFQYLAWKHKWPVEFVKEGTLINRPMPEKDDVMQCASHRELLQLPGDSSQWATAAVLDGSHERLTANVPFKLQTTYEAWEEWHMLQEAGESWSPRHDRTIAGQAQYFLGKLAGLPNRQFVIEQAEDFPFAYAFGLISTQEGFERFPALVGHESNRIVDTPEMIAVMRRGETVVSKDHRVVQAVAMLAITEGVQAAFAYPNVVAKSWPNFWEFLRTAQTTILGDER